MSEERRRFTELVVPHLTSAFRLACWLTGGRSDAEDVVQDAALRAFRSIERFEGGDARAWLLTITRNAAYSWLMRNRPAAIVMTGDLEAAERDSLKQGAGESVPSPEAALIEKADGEALKAAIAALPLAFRETLVLREVNGLAYAVIAEMTGVPIGTVMSRLARARRLLITSLGRDQ